MSHTTIQLDEMMPLIQERLAAGESVKFTPNGVSMRPMLEGGRDQVVLSAVQGRLKKYDLPLYRRDNGQYVLHRIVRCGDTYTCRGDNQLYNEPSIRQEQLIAVVTAFTRKGKTYSVHAFSYRLYCRLICWSRPIRRGFDKVRRILIRLTAS